jgi:hypothetical protein
LILSSILKALKRIEGQPPPPQSFPALPESVDAKQAVNSSTRRRWLLRRLIIAGLVLLVLVVSLVIFYQKRGDVIARIFQAPSPSTGPAKTEGAEKKSKIFKAKIPSTAAKPSTNRTEPSRRAKPQAKSPVVGQSATRTETAITKKPQQRPGIRTQEALNQSPRQTVTPSKKSIAGKRAALRKPDDAETAAPRNQRTKTTYARLNDSNIKLQALAWSADAARRMAVINGRIVREGESMDGYQINQIRQEDVVVSDGRQLWSLEFGLKQ